jgi:peptidoglycan/xylan/chitin deacetylase (PgdA/CDA1 family)
MKNYLFKLFSYLKLDQYALKRMHENQQGVILMYHGVTDSKIADGDWLQVYASEFEKQMKYVSENFMPVSLHNLQESLDEFSKPPCAITFDDGYKNVLTVALPILQKYNIPATVFLVTSYLDETKPKMFWWDKVFLKYHSTQFIESIKENVSGDIDAYVEQLIKENELTFTKEEIASYSIMNEADVKELLKSNLMSIGSHTKNHELLTHISNAEAYLTLSESYERLCKLGEECFYICYPNGYYTEEHLEMCDKIGYYGGVASDKGLVTSNSFDYQLPRLGVGRNTKIETFKYAVSGLSTIIHNFFK